MFVSSGVFWRYYQYIADVNNVNSIPAWWSDSEGGGVEWEEWGRPSSLQLGRTTVVSYGYT